MRMRAASRVWRPSLSAFTKDELRVPSRRGRERSFCLVTQGILSAASDVRAISGAAPHRVPQEATPLLGCDV